MLNETIYTNTKIVLARKATSDEISWFKLLPNSYILCIKNYPWFDTKAIATVDNGMFVDGHKIGLQIRGNLGTASEAIVDIEKTKHILSKSGYTLEII